MYKLTLVYYYYSNLFPWAGLEETCVYHSLVTISVVLVVAE